MTRHIKVYDATKTALGGKFIPLKAYLRKKLKLHISAQNFYFKKLGREEETKLRERRGVRVEIKARVRNTGTLFFVKINKKVS